MGCRCSVTPRGVLLDPLSEHGESTDMTLLVDFLCRFSFGLAFGLCITPATLVPSGFFRVKTLVLLGLTTFAALLSSTLGLFANTWLLSVAAIVAWIGSVLWYADRRWSGLICCGGAATLCAAATALTGELAFAQVGVRILSGCLIGFTVNAMLLGHWYLNAPGMRVDVLRRSIDQTLFVWGLLSFLVMAMIIWHFGAIEDRSDSVSTNLFRAVAAATSGVDGSLDSTGLALFWLRWLAGLIGLPVLLLMSRMTLDIPNTQSATGILYVACLAVILGELTAQLLGMTVKVESPVAQPARQKIWSESTA